MEGNRYPRRTSIEICATSLIGQDVHADPAVPGKGARELGFIDPRREYVLSAFADPQGGRAAAPVMMKLARAHRRQFALIGASLVEEIHVRGRHITERDVNFGRVGIGKTVEECAGSAVGVPGRLALFGTEDARLRFGNAHLDDGVKADQRACRFARHRALDEAFHRPDSRSAERGMHPHERPQRIGHGRCVGPAGHDGGREHAYHCCCKQRATVDHQFSSSFKTGFRRPTTSIAAAPRT